jgi:hypothetical protein
MSNRRTLTAIVGALGAVVLSAFIAHAQVAPGDGVSQSGSVTANHCAAWVGPGVVKDGGSCGSGNVTGPSSATASNLASFSGTTGKVIQDSGISGVANSSGGVVTSGGISATTSGLSVLTSTGTGTQPTFQTPSILSATSAGTPAGTSSATGVMMGVGSAWQLTPERSGVVTIHWSGTLADTSATSCAVTVRYGTGSIPTNGSSPAGTVISGTQQGGVAVASGTLPFGASTIIKNLAIGTLVWFDFDLVAPFGGTCSIQNTNVSADEK